MVWPLHAIHRTHQSPILVVCYNLGEANQASPKYLQHTMQLTESLQVTFINEKTCCKALEVLAEKHGIDTNHPYVKELQDLMNVGNNGCEDFPTFLVHSSQP